MADKVQQFIPEIWNTNVLRAEQKRLVFAGLANRNYQGDITSFGDTVKIPQVGDVTVNTYTKNSTSAISYQFAEDGQEILQIDQASYWAVRADDIDEVQSNIDFVSALTQQAGYKLADSIDSYLAGLYTQASLSVQSTILGSTNVEAILLQLGQTMDEANADSDGRFLIAPPWMIREISEAGITSLTDNTAMWQNGFMDRALGFNIYMSNNVSKASTSGEYRMLAGIQGVSLTFAEQIIKTEALRSEDHFTNYVRGLNVYGAKVIKPDVTAVLYGTNVA